MGTDGNEIDEDEEDMDVDALAVHVTTCMMQDEMVEDFFESDLGHSKQAMRHLEAQLEETLARLGSPTCSRVRKHHPAPRSNQKAVGIEDTERNWALTS